MATRIDTSDISSPCWRTDHNQGRLVNRARELAHEKHGVDSIEAVAADDPRWVAILGEEYGEVCHALTYDSGASVQDLADELVDIMAVAGAWLDAIRVDHGVHPALARKVWQA